MFVIRILGQAVFATGLGVLGHDIWRALVTGEFRLTAVGEWWFWIHKSSLQTLQPAIERHISPDLWDPGVQTLLEWPASIELLVIGALFWHLGRR